MKRSILIIGISLVILFGMQCIKKQKETKIRYSAPGFIKYDKLRLQQGKNFEKQNPTLETHFEPIMGQHYFAKIQTQIASGTEPDVYFMRDTWMPLFVEKDALMDLTDLIQQDNDFNLNDFHKVLVESYTYNNKIYGLAGSFTTGVLYYNKDIFDNNGIPYPDETWDWKKIEEIAGKLTKRNPAGFVEIFGIALEYYDLDFPTLVLQNNGKIFNKNKTRCVINSKAAKGAAQFMKRLIDKKLMPSLSDLATSESYQLFMGGQAAMFPGGRWYMVNFKDIKNFKWGVAPFFKGKIRKVRLDSHSWVLSKKTKNPKKAWQFLKYITGPEGNDFLVDVGDSVPTHKSQLDSGEFLKDKYNKIFIDSLPYAYPMKEIMSPLVPWDQMNKIIHEELEKYFIDKQNVNKMLKNMENRINKAIKESTET